MREKHPIDERFRQAVYHGEADPPEAVHAAVAKHLGWSNTPQTGGYWWPMVIVAVGVISTGAALWAWQDRPGQMALPDERSVAERQIVTSTAPTPDEKVVTPSSTAGPTTPVDQQAASSSSAFNASIEQRSTSTERRSEGTLSAPPAARTKTASGSTSTPSGTAVAAGAKASAPPSQGNTQQAKPNGERALTSGGRGTRPAALKGQDNQALPSATKSEGSAPGSTDIRTEPFAPATLSDPWKTALDLRSTMMDPLPIAPHAHVAICTPRNRALPPSYVLPSGTWWVGPYVGIGTVQGVWKGADAAALQEAEQWRSTAQGGLLVGREWRSGWGVSAGLGVARVRSTFHHDNATGWSSVLNVDTTWTPTIYTSGDILYSWQIDSLLEERPSASVRKDARNLYTAVQIPVLLSWHADARRFRYGAFGGVTAWIPTHRKGLTLVRSQQDTPPMTLALQDPTVNDRFRTQLHGTAGLSVGYTITEQLSAYAEPMISAPLLSFDGGNTPWLTRPILQFRIQYELRSKSR